MLFFWGVMQNVMLVYFENPPLSTKVLDLKATLQALFKG